METTAIAATETGDARYALKLLLKAGELADEKKLTRITDAEVEEARRNVDVDLAAETIATLPVHQHLTDEELSYMISCVEEFYS